MQNEGDYEQDGPHEEEGSRNFDRGGSIKSRVALEERLSNLANYFEKHPYIFLSVLGVFFVTVLISLYSLIF